MDWSHIFASAIGTLLGGMITIGALYVKERLDRRGAAQEWYEHNYIDEGTDKLLAHLKIILLQLRTFYETRKLLELRGENVPAQIPEILLRSKQNEPVPIESLNRLEILLQTDYLTTGIRVAGQFAVYCDIPPQHRSSALLEQLIGYTTALYKSVEGLRNTLLTVSIKRKSDVYRIRYDTKVASSLEGLKKANEEWLAGAAERSMEIRDRK